MAYIYNLTDTWTAVGTSYNGIKMAITNTASNASSYMINLSTSGATTGSFTVDKNGNAVVSGSLTLGSALGYAYGGTGLNTFTAANNAIYSTSASALTAGTLPVAAGGTGVTSLTTGYIPYGNGTNSLSSSANLTFDGTNFQVYNASVARIRVASGSSVFDFAQAGTSAYLSNNAAGSMFFQTANTAALTIDSSQKLYAPTVYSGAVGGTNKPAYVDNTGLLGYLSSTRASKMDIAPLTDVNWVMKLNPVSFKYRKRDEEGTYLNEPDGDLQYGLIAEEVVEENALICYVDDSGKLEGVAYNKLVVPVLKALQKLRQEFDEYVKTHP